LKRELTVAVLALLMLLLLSSTGLAWNFERPGKYIDINERTENAKTDGKASVGLGVHISCYSEDESGPPSYGDDYAKLCLAATANTRKILDYDWCENYYLWVDESQLTNELILCDEVSMISLPFKVRFYGGPGSAEYDHVWLCSNGWLSFVDLDHPNQPPPYCDNSDSIPNTNGLNNFVAPFWTYLGLSTIRYGTVGYTPGGPAVSCFVISWNVTWTGYHRQIFQVLIEEAPTEAYGRSPYDQSRIWFQYHSLYFGPPFGPATVGIEDQRGRRGVAYNYENLHNGTALEFSEASGCNYARIMNIAIRLSENENSAETKVVINPDSIRGHNIILNQSLPPEDETEKFATAIGGAATLLIDAIEILGESPPIWVTGAGFMIGATMFIVDWAHEMARKQAVLDLLQIDYNNTYVRARGFEPIYNTDPVDADLCITAYWIFDDLNTENHSLTVTAELTYEEFDAYGYRVNLTTISTSVELRMSLDDNNSSGTAVPIEKGTLYSKLYLGGYDEKDFYKIYVYGGRKIIVTAEANSSYNDLPDFQIFLHDWYGFEKAYTLPGYSHHLEYVADTTGYWFIEARLCTNDGFYSLKVDLKATGGCPSLFVWNGSDYFEEGILDIHAKTDVTIQHQIQNTLALNNFVYKLQLRELDNFTSHIDQVKLYAVDYEGEWHLCPLIYACHNDLGCVTWKLLFDDENRIDLTPTQQVNLKFLSIIPQNWATHLIFEINGHNPKPNPE